ncbi:MAG: hypothetical protein DRG50_02160 [Deltaproteobacteria bacterium]|nr:MAG: hypothetical protein DRG50_02160 [Deltaproteobacteria bacterium]
MRRNLELTKGLIHSQQLLLALIRKGISRGDAYQWVQRNAMRAWSEGKDFRSIVAADKDITNILSEKEINDIFDLNIHLRYVNEIFKRVFTVGREV